MALSTRRRPIRTGSIRSSFKIGKVEGQRRKIHRKRLLRGYWARGESANRTHLILEIGSFLAKTQTLNSSYFPLEPQKYMSHDLLTRITEGKRAHINGVVVMQRYCDAMRLSQLSDESSQWTRNRAHSMALLYFGFPDSQSV